MTGGMFGSLGRSPLTDRLRAAGIRADLIAAAGSTAFGRQSDLEVSELPALLHEDEVVLQLLEGRNGKAVGLLVLTTRRIVFAAQARYGLAPLVIDRSDVVSATGHVHRGLSVLTLVLTSGDFVVDRILGAQAETFAGNAQAPPEQLPAADPLAELAELRALHQAGMIGDGEFTARKRRLFDQI